MASAALSVDTPPKHRRLDLILLAELVVVAWLVFLLHGPKLYTFELFVCLLIAVSLLQAALELIIVLPLTGRPGWRFALRWWEGVIVGYGACGVTLYLAGWTVSLFESGLLKYDVHHCDAYLRWPLHLQMAAQPWASLWPLFLVMLFEVVLIQWLIIRVGTDARLRRVSGKRLLLACALAKTVTLTLWLLGPFPIIRI